jgi:hypothetical protein
MITMNRTLHILPLFLLPLFLADAQIDTNRIGFLDKSNAWSGENSFLAHLVFPKQQAHYPGQTIFKARISDSARVTYGITGCEHATANSNGFSETSISFGINLAGNVRDNLSEPAFAYTIEDDYAWHMPRWNSTRRGIEYHMGGVTANGVGIRPETAGLDRQTGYGIYKNLNFDQISFSDGTSAAGMLYGVDGVSRTHLMQGTLNFRDTTGATLGSNQNFLSIDWKVPGIRLGSLNSQSSTLLFDNLGNFTSLINFIRRDTIYIVPLLQYDSTYNRVILGSNGGAVSDPFRTAAVRIGARQINMDINSRESGIEFSGANRIALDAGQLLTTQCTTFGKDSSQLATKGYVDTKFADTTSGLSAIIRDSLDANARKYVPAQHLADSMQAARSEAMLLLRDSLDANVRRYIDVTDLRDTLDANRRAANFIRDTLNANARGFLRAPDLAALDVATIPAMHTAIKDTLDANARGYIRASELPQLGYAPESFVKERISDSLDANSRMYVSFLELRDTLDANARSGDGITPATLRDSLDANTRTVIRPPFGLCGSTIDWRAAEVFIDTLSDDTMYDFAGIVDGKTIVVIVANLNKNYSVKWPAEVKWPAGKIPSQSGSDTADVYTFIKAGPFIFGAVVQEYPL